MAIRASEKRVAFRWLGVVLVLLTFHSLHHFFMVRLANHLLAIVALLDVQRDATANHARDRVFEFLDGAWDFGNGWKEILLLG